MKTNRVARIFNKRWQVPVRSCRDNSFFIINVDSNFSPSSWSEFTNAIDFPAARTRDKESSASKSSYRKRRSRWWFIAHFLRRVVNLLAHFIITRRDTCPFGVSGAQVTGILNINPANKNARVTSFPRSCGVMRRFPGRDSIGFELSLEWGVTKL